MMGKQSNTALAIGILAVLGLVAWKLSTFKFPEIKLPSFPTSQPQIIIKPVSEYREISTEYRSTIDRLTMNHDLNTAAFDEAAARFDVAARTFELGAKAFDVQRRAYELKQETYGEGLLEFGGRLGESKARVVSARDLSVKLLGDIRALRASAGGLNHMGGNDVL